MFLMKDSRLEQNIGSAGSNVEQVLIYSRIF